jgi:hypothetical protein
MTVPGGSRNFNRLTVDALGEADAVLVTIERARVQNFSGNYLAASGDQKVVLNFAEFPDADYVVNSTSFHRLCDHYGNSQSEGFRPWVGKVVVLVKQETSDPRDGSKVVSLWVASEREWKATVDAYAAEARMAKARAAKVPTVTPGKPRGRRPKG